jgi:tetratricopeptide (TPR) repeat protein
MANSLTSLERELLLSKLQRAFEAPQAEVLVTTLEWVAAKGRDGWATREDFSALKETVAEMAAAQRDLAAAQARTEERVGRLEEAVAGLAAAQRDLAAAQARTEERVGRLEEAMERLAQAQARTEERVGRLEEAMERLAQAQARTEHALERLSRQVGGLSETVGGDIEDIAYIVLHEVLKRELGWDVGPLERTWQRWDSKLEEVNVFGPARDPVRPDQAIWIVGEAKHNLTLKEVERFARQVQRAREHLVGEVFPVCFCYRARPEVQERVRALGLRLVFSYGKMV